MRRRLAGLVLILLAFGATALGQAAASVGGPSSVGGPCPAHLFVLGRNKNSNIVVYDAKLGPAGDFVASEPVVAYWLLNGEKGSREELNRIERQRAYGFNIKPGQKPGTYEMTFKAGRGRRLTIGMLEGCAVGTGSIGGHDGILRRLFVQAGEGSLRPTVDYVELFGEDVASRGPLYEKFTPGK